MASFIHHHVHSAFSLAEGAIKVDRLLSLCKAHDMPAVSVADANNLFGALELSETLAAAGVQPIPGLQQSVEVEALAGAEPRWARPPGLVLLAQNVAGFANLMALTSRAFLTSARDDGPCAQIDWLADVSEGILCLTGGYDGPIDRLVRAGRADEAHGLLSRLVELFPDRLYVELQRHRPRDWSASEAFLVDAAYGDGLPLVATNEPLFSEADDYEAHDALLCVADGAYVHQEDRRRATPEHYFKGSAAMAALFADAPEAIENSVEIARRCAFRPRTRAPILPRFGADAAARSAATAADGGDAGLDAAAVERDELARQAREGLKARLASNRLAAAEQDYWDRLAFELDIINRMGFPGYFLIVADFIKWAKAAGVPVGPGRGSGAGSLVAWSLTITDLDPLRFGLLFERFLNPERVSMPDFDVDFCQDRRDEVIAYVQEKYGRDRVAQIITFGKLQARAVLRDVGRVLGMPFGQVDRLCKFVPNNPANPVTLAEAVANEPKLAEERDRDEAVAALLKTALKLEGLYRHASTHAAGVVIGDRPLQELTPLYRDPRADMPATQYNMKWVEPAGLVKFDFLGLKTLTVIQKAVAFARADGREIDLDGAPLDDPATYAMLGEGAAVGVFQLESAGMRATLKGMRPDSLEDVIALISLYRPGPMENIPTYIERKQGLQAPDYLHPSLEPVLKETYGVIIYQEQVMQIAQILSGYSLGEADLLRRAMGKKKKEEMDRQRKRFVEGAEANGVGAAKASSIFDLVQKFAGYGFNKSHAAAYAFIAYQTAYLKANEPAAFIAASMSLDRVNTDKLAVFLNEARRIDVEVRAPHVNYSDADFHVSDGAVVYALSAVKNVGEAAMAEIASERRARGPFADLYDFAERVDLKAVGKRAFENLARAGAFDGLCASRAAAFANADLAIRFSAQVRQERGGAQAGLFDADDAGLARPRLADADAWAPLDMLNEERAAFGFYFSGHPLDDYAEELSRLGATTFAALASAAKGQDGDGRVFGEAPAVVRGVRMRRSRAGKPFAWVQCSEADGDVEATAFAEVLAQSRELLEPGAILLFRVSAEERDGEARFVIEAARPLDAAAAGAASQLRVHLASPDALASVQSRLRAIKPPDPGEAGDVVVAFALEGQGGRSVSIKLPEPAACTPAARGALRAVDGVVDVEIV